MADISKITTTNGTTYNLKDAYLRGQVVELTQAEYDLIPDAVKQSDDKLYFITDGAYEYRVDDEPMANSRGLVKSGGIYKYTSKVGTGTLDTTAQTLIPAVNELKGELGSTDISEIGDGTVSGAISKNAEDIAAMPTFEFGTATTSGQTRTITLSRSYSDMKYFSVTLTNAMNVYLPRAVTFTPPNTVTFQFTYLVYSGGAWATDYNTGTCVLMYVFVGTPAD